MVLARVVMLLRFGMPGYPVAMRDVKLQCAR